MDTRQNRRSGIVFAALAAAAAVVTGCGGGGDDGGSCGSANQCVAVTVAGNGYTIRNSCNNPVQVRWCEQLSGGSVCDAASDGFSDTFGGGQSREYTAVRVPLSSVHFCAS